MSTALIPPVDMFGYRSPDPPACRKSRITNDPSVRSNQSTASGRRLYDLLRGFLADMGNPSSVIAQADALAAAELTVALEDARAELLAGKGDADKVVRLGGEVRRAVKRLGIDRQRGAKPKKSLAEYLREKAAPSSDPTKATAA